MMINEGPLDRIMRGVGGTLVLFVTYIAFTGWMQYVGYVFAGMLFFTAITGFCGLYKILGINTNASST